MSELPPTSSSSSCRSFLTFSHSARSLPSSTRISACPVGPYYSTGFKPVKLLATTSDVRAWPGSFLPVSVPPSGSVLTFLLEISVVQEELEASSSDPIMLVESFLSRRLLRSATSRFCGCTEMSTVSLKWER